MVVLPQNKTKCFLPSDLLRKLRLLNEIDPWKSTELRLFLIYI